jgi:proteasome lid subunit RPN8/RPN11
MSSLPDYSCSRAILIGTATYKDSRFPSVPAAANSLTGMREVLTDPRLCGWPSERITFLRDPAESPRLIQRLRRLAKETKDVLLVYFVGHGTILRRGKLCLAISDTDADDPDITGLEYDRIRDALLDSPARMKVVILDCCYAGRAIEALAANETGIADSTDIRGVYTMTASDQIAHVPPPNGQADVATSFTGEFLDLVRKGVYGGPIQLTMSDIYVHLRYRLQARGLPEPNQRGTDTASMFAFVRNAARDRDRQSRTQSGHGLVILDAIYDAMVAHARVEHPNTACGVIAGPSGSDRPKRFIPMWNAEESPIFWRFDTKQQMTAWLEMDRVDEQPVIIYYSHTATPAYPSRTTIAYAAEPHAHYVIVSTRDLPEVEVRSFSIVDGVVTEEDIHVVSSYDYL